MLEMGAPRASRVAISFGTKTVGSIIGDFVVYLVMKYFWSEHMPLKLNNLYQPGVDPVVNGLEKVWFLFPAAAVLALGVGILNRGVGSMVLGLFGINRSTGLALGTWRGINVGVMEELSYRWLLLPIYAVLLTFFNFITFGFIKWLFHLGAWIVNPITFGLLNHELTGHSAWTFGAAILAATFTFTDERELNSTLSKILNWILAMTMFWVVFHYGILAAVAVRIIFEVIWNCVFVLTVTHEFDRIEEPRRSY